MKKLTTEEFINRAKTIHGDKYDYSEVDYKGSFIKVKIFCRFHKKFFWQDPNTHLNNKSGCPICAIEEQKKTTEEFIKKSKSIWGNKYDYRFANYINANTKIKLLCNDCGNIIEQTPSNHYHYNCKFCSLKTKANKIRKTTEYFIKKAKKVHGDKYDYSKVEYVRNDIKVKIICPIHKEFLQTPNNHVNGTGCPICKSSKGELKVENFLKSKSITAERNKTFEELKDSYPLSYDFYIKEKNLLIEFHGVQHKEFQPFFHKTIHDFHRQKHHDWLKRKYAIKHNINLLIVWYYEDINKKLSLVF